MLAGGAPPADFDEPVVFVLGHLARGEGHDVRHERTLPTPSAPYAYGRRGLADDFGLERNAAAGGRAASAVARGWSEAAFPALAPCHLVAQQLLAAVLQQQKVGRSAVGTLVERPR
ncbi:hypothetical protein GCM10010339_60420 [Streptomyces alanosinicus]|uniref:Uncharacterized protein n=1 Tax=Streptomyces alanosinicus TaxID=68171 RepID=A0A919D595_9ACTN|nr:hypothetical protein GCM10010339_60420 [Streptomyces alanosinicus]